MPLGILQNTSLRAALNINRLTRLAEKLEREHGFYFDTGAWCCSPCAIANAREMGEGKKQAFWDEQREEWAHDGGTLTMMYGFGMFNPPEEITSAVGEELINHLAIEGFKCKLDKKYFLIKIDLDRDLNDPEDPAHLAVEIEIKDTPEAWKRYGDHPIYEYDGDGDEDIEDIEERIVVTLLLEEGESVADVIRRNKIDPAEIFRYKLVIETEDLSEAMMPMWPFDAFWMKDDSDESQRSCR